ncbi:MAG: response regulator [Bdellovibrionales bacterium]|nr:response regulator [Bdellovibrionales bacterium]
MQKSDIHILIVDDDVTIAKALSAALEREGFSCKVTGQIDEARAAFRHTEFHVIILDCVLPVMSGVDFAQELRREFGNEFHLFLTSGIFKDPHFVKDAIQKTRALEFFAKPFDLSNVLNSIKESIADILPPERDPLTDLLFTLQPEDADLAGLINSLDQIDGNSLPIIFSALNQSQLTGDLNLTYSNGEVSSISYKNGAIYNVNVKDESSYFGILLVEKGFCSAKDVEVSLASQSGFRLGETMTFSNMLSPHAIKVVQIEQMAIRMSKTIVTASVKPHFIEGNPDDIIEECSIESLSNYLLDWVLTKLPSGWISTFFVPWLDYTFEPSQNFQKMDLLSTYAVFKELGDLKKMIIDNLSLQEILGQAKPRTSKTVQKILFFLLLENQIRFHHTAKNSKNIEGKLARFKKILEDMKNQNHFEVLGLNLDANKKSIQTAYHELAKVLHPDKLPKNADEEMRRVTTELFGRITKAYQVLTNSESKSNYLTELKFGSAEKALEAEGLFEEAVALMHRNRFRDAYKIFKAIQESPGIRQDIEIYLAWARLKVGAPDSRQAQLFQKVKRHINNVPPEERHTYMFFFVKGLYYRMTHRYEKAQTYYNNCLVLNGQFEEARKELKAIERYIGEDDEGTYTAQGVVTAIVSNFFNGTKKKKSS